jgi:hypothetical protein
MSRIRQGFGLDKQLNNLFKVLTDKQLNYQFKR